MIQLTDKTAQAFLKDNYNRLVLLYFGAPWCGPCKAMGPIVESIEDTVAVLPLLDRKAPSVFVGRQIAKINVDEAPILSTTYEVRSVPTCILLYKDRTPPAVLRGAVPKEKLLRWLSESIEKCLKGSP